jgi:hypothetical protein
VTEKIFVAEIGQNGGRSGRRSWSENLRQFVSEFFQAEGFGDVRQAVPAQKFLGRDAEDVTVTNKNLEASTLPASERAR